MAPNDKRENGLSARDARDYGIAKDQSQMPLNEKEKIVETTTNDISLSLEFLRSGVSFDGDCGSDPEKTPPWLDKGKFECARKVFKKYFFSIFYGHLAGLLMIVHIPSILSPLLATGNSANLIKIYRRYVDTMLHIKGWYEGDVWNPADPAHQSILQVRHMHRRVANMIKLSKVKGKEDVAISQFDMAITQFAFVGLLVLYPKQIGLHCTKEELESLVHFWRGIGYLLGIEDRYNICSGRNHDDTLQLYKALFEQEFKPRLVQPNPRSTIMGKEIIVTAGSFVYLLTWEGFVCCWAKLWGISVNVTHTLYTGCCYLLMQIVFNYLLYLSVFREFFNLFLRYAVRSAIRNKKFKERKLEKLLKGG